jgi:hypothetical protein
MAFSAAAHPACQFCAGLAAYASWTLTLEALMKQGGPVCVFTDFCEEAAFRGAQVLEAIATSAGVPDDFSWCWIFCGELVTL